MRPAGFKDADGLLRVDVLRAHEPSRLVGADREDGETRAAEPLERLAENTAVAEAGIADVVGRPAWRRDHEGGPQRHAAVAEPARRPVI